MTLRRLLFLGRLGGLVLVFLCCITSSPRAVGAHLPDPGIGNQVAFCPQPGDTRGDGDWCLRCVKAQLKWGLEDNGGVECKDRFSAIHSRAGAEVGGNFGPVGAAWGGIVGVVAGQFYTRRETMAHAIGLAKIGGHNDLAFEMAVVTQCHNPGIEDRLRSCKSDVLDVLDGYPGTFDEPWK